jgi:hypothetical protein
MDKRVPTEHDQKIWAMDLISKQLPIVFPDKITYETIEFRCSTCNQILEDKNIHGSIDQTYKDVATCEAIGYCKSCDIATPFNMRLRSSGNIQFLFDNKWHTMSAKRKTNKLSIWDKLLPWRIRATPKKQADQDK